MPPGILDVMKYESRGRDEALRALAIPPCKQTTEQRAAKASQKGRTTTHSVTIQKNEYLGGCTVASLSAYVVADGASEATDLVVVAKSGVNVRVAHIQCRGHSSFGNAVIVQPRAQTLHWHFHRRRDRDCWDVQRRVEQGVSRPSAGGNEAAGAGGESCCRHECGGDLHGECNGDLRWRGESYWQGATTRRKFETKLLLSGRSLS